MRTLLILGSGMSSCFLPEEYDIVGDITSSVEGHPGKLVMLRGDEGVLVSLGRRHLYEGWRVKDIQEIVVAAAARGARNLIVTNAAGGLNPRYRAGDIMLIEGSLGTLLGGHAGGRQEREDENAGGLFISPHRTAEPFATGLYRRIEERALEQGIRLQRGIYTGVLGPSYETRAEIGMLRRMGADAVGMSTVLEAAAARELGMRTIGLSLITNILSDTARIGLDHGDVVEQGRSAAARMRSMLDICFGEMMNDE